MGTAMNLVRTSATLAANPIDTAKGWLSFGKVLAHRVDVNHIRPQTPMDNAALYAETERTPVVWLGGILTDPSHHLKDQLDWQGRGVPFYITDNGHGLRTAKENAATLRDTIMRAKAETGASKVYVAGQSKGCVDIMTTLLDYPELAPHIKGVFFHGGAFDGGFTTDPGKAQALRGLVNYIDSKLPDRMKGGLQAAHELTHGTPHLESMRERFPQFVANMPEDMHLTNYISHLKGTNVDGQPGHDLFIPINSQRLPDFDQSLPQAKQIEEVSLGEVNHIVTHREAKTIEHMDNKMWELDHGLNQDWRQ